MANAGAREGRSISGTTSDSRCRRRVGGSSRSSSADVSPSHWGCQSLRQELRPGHRTVAVRGSIEQRDRSSAPRRRETGADKSRPHQGFRVNRSENSTSTSTMTSTACPVAAQERTASCGPRVTARSSRPKPRPRRIFDVADAAIGPDHDLENHVASDASLSGVIRVLSLDLAQEPRRFDAAARPIRTAPAPPPVPSSTPGPTPGPDPSGSGADGFVVSLPPARLADTRLLRKWLGFGRE